MLGEFEYVVDHHRCPTRGSSLGCGDSGRDCADDGTQMLPWCALHNDRSARNERSIKDLDGRCHPQRGGRAKRMIRVTAKGVQAATDFYDAVTRVSRGASWVVN